MEASEGRELRASAHHTCRWHRTPCWHSPAILSCSYPTVRGVLLLLLLPSFSLSPPPLLSLFLSCTSLHSNAVVHSLCVDYNPHTKSEIPPTTLVLPHLYNMTTG
eukprot:754632-Hanusia_phi.AAC.3